MYQRLRNLEQCILLLKIAILAGNVGAVLIFFFTLLSRLTANGRFPRGHQLLISITTSLKQIYFLFLRSELVALYVFTIFIAVLISVIFHSVVHTRHLRNEFNFWNVHGIMNTSGLLQSK